ncbi:MAG: NACHT domain-containing protein, partial [Thiohalocapsa sp.]
MSAQDSVRWTRDGDQFHYQWAARKCLGLLPGGGDLVAVTIEGPSAQESAGEAIEAGQQLIDVGLYYGAETPDAARLVRYIQLKHSTHRSSKPSTASDLKKTIKGFAERYAQLIERYPADQIAQRFQFEFTTNRPIETKVQEALTDLVSGNDVQNPRLQQTLIGFTGLDMALATQFFRLFSTASGEGDLWEQRNLLRQDLNAYLPDADYDAPVQLTELVTRRATTESAADPAIRRHDVLHALNVSKERLQPAECLIPDASDKLPREQEPEVILTILNAEHPVIIHADGGVGKSVLAARLAASMPQGSEAVLYDCFGNGLYRTALHYRHQHRDAFVQMANELAARGLCHPLIPSDHADTKRYMLAFAGRLRQAVSLLQAKDPGASLCLIIDAADNAEMAAEEFKQPASFVQDLIRGTLPRGVRLVLTCRTHRRWRLKAPPQVQEIQLRPFSERETALHLRGVYPTASDAEVAEFAFLSSSNPRVQALALSQGLPLHDMLRQLGPTPTTMDGAIGQLLDAAVAKIRDEAGPVDASQIDAICQGIAVLRPLVPIAVLAKLSDTSEGAVRSFALDLRRPLLLKGDSLHFIDEPAETWFRERFQPDAAGLADFIERLRPLAAQSAYVAAVLPALLLRAGQLDELVQLALSGEGLPAENPVERRDVEIQRLRFALTACLSQGRYLAAAKLALKAGGECAGESRQTRLMQDNTDLVAVLMEPDRIEALVSRRTFG